MSTMSQNQSPVGYSPIEPPPSALGRLVRWVGRQLAESPPARDIRRLRSERTGSAVRAPEGETLTGLRAWRAITRILRGHATFAWTPLVFFPLTFAIGDIWSLAPRMTAPQGYFLALGASIVGFEGFIWPMLKAVAPELLFMGLLGASLFARVRGLRMVDDARLILPNVRLRFGIAVGVTFGGVGVGLAHGFGVTVAPVVPVFALVPAVWVTAEVVRTLSRATGRTPLETMRFVAWPMAGLVLAGLIGAAGLHHAYTRPSFEPLIPFDLPVMSGPELPS